VDGADEVSPTLDLIKGMGGALLREKMVAQASSRLVIIADESKVVDRLGLRSPLPIEVVEWGMSAHMRFMEGRGARVTVRVGRAGTPERSDNGNLFLDCRFADGIEDPAGLEELLRARSGVVESGLFLGMAHLALIASGSEVQTMRRSA
jgi:ribose 5-phosphate isomerase A